MERARNARSKSMIRKTTTAAITVVVVATAASFLLDNFGGHRQPDPTGSEYVEQPVETQPSETENVSTEAPAVWADEGDESGAFYDDNIVEDSDGDNLMIPPDDGSGQMVETPADTVTMPPEFDQ